MRLISSLVLVSVCAALLFSLPVCLLIPALRGLSQKYKETPQWHIAIQKNVTFRKALTGLSVLLRNAIVVIYSRGALQPLGIRRYANGVNQLSPLRPVLGNDDPLNKILQNALTFERVLQRPAPICRSPPSHLWTTNRSRIRYSTSQ